MPLVPVQIPPGMYRAGTEYQSRGRWYDGSLVRFYAGVIRPVGGWEQINPSAALTGRPCAAFGWRPNLSSIGRYLAIGTEQKAYVYDGSSTTEITPTSFTTGLASATTDGGYGAGLYGAGTYGTPRSGQGGVTPIDFWHFDAWGENLVGCYTADGRLLEWDLNTSNDFAAISNAPTSCRGLVVSAERMLFALGAGGDVRKIQWSDQEDNTTWSAGTTTTAGDLLLSTDGRIVTGERVRGGILVHTDTDVHLVTYVGAPFYYGVERIGDNCGIVSANAKVSAGVLTAWMGENGFWVYDGYVKPIPCDVHDYVFSDINRVQISKVAAWHNGEFGEIWWHYPSGGSTENDRYVVWNYREGHWSIGQLERTAGVGEGAWRYPIATDASGYWYEHEKDFDADGAARFLESGPLEIPPGERMSWLNQCIHDESESVDALELTIKTKFTPEGTEYTAGPYTLDAANGYTDVRAQGRAYKLRFDEVSEVAWRLGTMRFDVRVGGKR